MSSVVQGVPVGDSAPTTASLIDTSSLPLAHPSIASDEAVRVLTRTLDYPRGLAQQIAASCQSMPYHFWIVDNSGSMQKADGKRLVRDTGGTLRSISATRWEELCQVVLQTAEVAAAVGARIDFHLLNRDGLQPQYLTLDSSADDAIPAASKLSVAELRRRMQSTIPAGRTPLTAAVQQISALLRPVASRLQAAGQRSVVVLCTDGLPDDSHSFLGALQELQALPVWLVVRLCTDDDGVVSYWNDLDARLEAPLEVLDDEVGEAREVHEAGNQWLTYAPQLQLARQFGMQSKLFDLIDETALLPSQIAAFCEELLGCDPLPEPEVDTLTFVQVLKAQLAEVPNVYDPLTRRMRPWIDPTKIGMRGSKSALCALL